MAGIRLPPPLALTGLWTKVNHNPESKKDTLVEAGTYCYRILVQSNNVLCLQLKEYSSICFLGFFSPRVFFFVIDVKKVNALTQVSELQHNFKDLQQIIILLLALYVLWLICDKCPKPRCADWTSHTDTPLCLATRWATSRSLLISKTDSGKSRWEWPGETEGNLRLHTHLGMAAGDGMRNSKTGEERVETH